MEFSLEDSPTHQLQSNQSNQSKTFSCGMEPPPPPSLAQILSWVDTATDDEATTVLRRIRLDYPQPASLGTVTRSKAKRQKIEQKAVETSPRAQLPTVAGLLAIPLGVFSLVVSMLSLYDRLVVNNLSHASRVNAGLPNIFPPRDKQLAWPKEIKFPSTTTAGGFLAMCATGSLTAIDLSCTSVKPWWLSRMAKLPVISLIRLDLSNSENLVDEHGLYELAGTYISKLQSLIMNKCEFQGSCKGLQCLQFLDELRIISANYSELSCDSLRSFALVGSLQTLSLKCADLPADGILAMQRVRTTPIYHLDLTSTGVNDEDMLCLASMDIHKLTLTHCTHFTSAGAVLDKLLHPSLVCLDLKDCPQIDDAMIQQLSALTQLRSLDLSRCKNFSNTALHHLMAMKSLRILRLCNTQLVNRDEGLLSLAKHTSLTDIYVSGNISTLFTTAWDMLQAAYQPKPHITVHYSGPVVLVIE